MNYLRRYTTTTQTIESKWEATEGLDPFSFGYNAATPASKYKTPQQVVHSLVDIVSKNGNYLLDIGPKVGSLFLSLLLTYLQCHTGGRLRSSK